MTTLPEIIEGMSIRTFHGVLAHKNPNCDECGNHCFAVYRGGRKEKMSEIFVCKNCNIFYALPAMKRCEFTEVQPQ